MPRIATNKSALAAASLLLLLTSSAGFLAFSDEPPFSGPRIEITAARWTRRAQLAFVNETMRCAFVGTNESTQLQEIALRAQDGGFVPLTARAGPRLERFPEAAEGFERLADGFHVTRRLPPAAVETARGASIRMSAGLRLAGKAPLVVMEEEIRFLRAGKISAECFAIDVTPAQPDRAWWRDGETTGSTNRFEEGLLRVPARSLAVAGSHGVVVMRLSSAEAGSSPLPSEALVRHDSRGTRCSFIVTRDAPRTDPALRLQLELRLLPKDLTQERIEQSLMEN